MIGIDETVYRDDVREAYERARNRNYPHNAAFQMAIDRFLAHAPNSSLYESERAVWDAIWEVIEQRRPARKV